MSGSEEDPGGEEPGPGSPEPNPGGDQDLFDGIVSTLLDIGDFLDRSPSMLELLARQNELDEETFQDFVSEEGFSNDVLGAILDQAIPVDIVADTIIDVAEESILAPLQATGELTPVNVEDKLDAAEGNAGTLLTGVLVASSALEGGSGGQFDAVPAEIIDIVATVGALDLIGREIDARLQDGVDPALKQKVHADHRSKQASFEDFLEANLRQKGTNPNVDPRETPVSGATRDLFHPDDFGFLSEPDEYGTRPGQEPLYELVGMAVSEPEEIIEEPIQYGLPIPARPVEQLGELQGFPEDVKDVFLSVIDQLPKTENLIQEYIRLTEFNFRLREKVQAGVLTPDEAVTIIEPEIRDLLENPIADDRYRPEDRTADEVTNIVANELRRNFELLQSLPSDPPTAGDIQSFYRKGVIDRSEFIDLQRDFGRGNQRSQQYLTEQTIDKGPEEIRRQSALGRLSDGEAQAQLLILGFSPAEATNILNGGDPSAIITDRLQDRTETDQFPVDFAVEVGDARSQQLRIGGITSLQDLQNASISEVTTLTGMSDTEAQQAIASAETLLRERAQRAEDS